MVMKKLWAVRIAGTGLVWGLVGPAALGAGAERPLENPHFPIGHDNPQRIAAGDIDGDGDADAAVTWIDVEPGGNIEGIRIMVDEFGVFTQGQELACLDLIEDILLRDIDGDGDLDLLAAVRDDFVTIWLNSLGTFGAPVNLGVGGRPVALVAEDLDGDADRDIALADRQEDRIGVLFNAGDGTFGPMTGYATGPDPHDLIAGDFDSDGDIDLVVNNGVSGLSLRRNNGAGGFGPPVATPGIVPKAGADMDGDGVPEVIGVQTVPSVPSGMYAVAVYEFVPSGTFQLVHQSEGIAFEQPIVVVADVDTDGDSDILTSHSHEVGLLRNEGGGAVAAPVLLSTGPHAVSEWGQAIDVGDVDVDGRPDILFAHAMSSGMGVLRQRLDGGFGPRWVGSGGQGEAYPLLADMDGDGAAELIVVTDEPGLDHVLTVVPNLGCGSFAFDAALYLEEVEDFTPPAVGDVDGDGDTDIVYPPDVCCGGKVGVAFNDGAGNFSTAHFNAGVLPRHFLVGDFTGDGNPDIAMRSEFFKFSVLPGDGAGGFSAPIPSSPVSTNDFVLGFAAGDVDDDGDLDLVMGDDAGSSPGGTVEVALNDGTGIFNAWFQVPVGLRPEGVAAADFDGDGETDIAAAGGNSDPSEMYILWNGGDAGSWTVQTFESGRDTEAVHVTDLDEDGRVDILVSSAFDGTINVFRNLGGRSFTQRLPHGAAWWYPGHFGLGDIDKDQDLDLVVEIGLSSIDEVMRHGFSVLRNQRFSTSGAALPDLDGDGVVGSTDLNQVLFNFGCTSGDEVCLCPGDVDGDGDTDSIDLGLVLRYFSVALEPGAAPGA